MDIELIKSQSGCDDIEKITEAYNECKGNITNTILKLLNITVEEDKPKLTQSEIFRIIMDSKECAYLKK